MREPASLATAVILSLLLSFADSVTESAGMKGNDHSQRLNSEWQILTKQNFSSEIRLHPRILLMVTIPWSGEALSLMRQLEKLVANQSEKFGNLRLMVVYKNSQKMLADVLGATDDITLYYYHQSTSYKYHGRFAAEKILSSINYFMSLKSEVVPFKPLYSQNELKIFLKSTDKAVLLIELCGWSSKLLHKKSIENLTSAKMNFSENDDMFRANLFAKFDKSLLLDMKKNQKGLENEGLSCDVENGMADSHWAGEYSWANRSALEEMEYETVDINLSCTEKEFEQFKSFFSTFEVVAREFFLPPEMIRFGLISERSLLPYVGVSIMGAWLAMLQFNGCPSCSITLKEGDDLRMILQAHHSPVMRLDVDRPNLEPEFPSNRPSVVLFIDRLSDSQVIRKKSKLALDVFRKLEVHYRPSYKMRRGVNHGYPQSPTVQVVSESRGPVVSDSSSLHFMKDSLSPKLFKIKDNMAIVINKGQSILSDRTASYAQGNAVYDALLDFINKRNLNRKKESKISLLAKENGFQLLSDDFEVQVLDSSPYYNENNQLSDMNKHTVPSLGSQNFELHQSPNKDSVNTNDDLLAAIEVPAVDDVKQPALGDSEDDIQKYLEADTEDKSNPNELGVEVLEVKDAFGKHFSSLIDEVDKSSKKNDMGSNDENSELEREVSSVGTCQEKDTVDCCSSSIGTAEKVSLVDPVEDFSADDGAQVEKNVMSKSSEALIQRQPFQCSFFFIDGGYQLLSSLSGGSNIPSLVLLDPIEQQHYVFTEDRDIDFNSYFNFVEKFFDGSLSPFRPSASSIPSSKEAPRPPFVNLDFHEIDAIPRLTTNTFCELVFGFNPCVTENAFPTSQVKKIGAAWKTDVLVLFGSSWCGFCQRMELLLREVYRAFNNLKNILKCESNVINPVCYEDNSVDVVEYSLPSIFLMDCTQNDCRFFLKSVGRDELYPELLLYSAKNKSAIPYEGDTSVVNIIKFLVSQGRNSQYLHKYKGFLWKHSLNNSKRKSMPHDPSPFPISKTDPYSDDSLIHNIGGRNQPLPAESPAPNSLPNKAHYIVTGSILSATDKLREAIPFDNSTILITLVDEGQALQGIILNKPIRWNFFENLDSDMEPMKQAPIFYGGPVRAQGLPLVSLARIPTEGYTKVIHGVYFGNPMITSMVIEGIKSGDRSCHDYWFFLGYSSWKWDQFLSELTEGAWNLSDDPIESINWPNS